MTWQLMQANGKKRGLHLTGQDRAQTRTRSFITQDPDQIFAVVGRGKERETLNVIPVRVCNEKCQLDCSWSQLLLQRKPETTNSSARVEHDNFAVGPHFYATGITTIPDRRRPWHGEQVAQNNFRSVPESEFHSGITICGLKNFPIRLREQLGDRPAAILIILNDQNAWH